MENTEQILKNIGKKISMFSTQTEIAKSLNIEQNMLSKRLSGHTKMTLNDLVQIANALNMSISELISDNTDAINSKYFRQSCPIQMNMGIDGDGIVLDPEKISYNHFLGEYYFYSRPTIRDEKGFLKGKLILKKDQKNKLCLATLALKTGRKDQHGNEIVKEYAGQAAISLPTGTFYIFMVSEKYNDFCFLNFKHSYFNDDDLMCRICGCMTASAGISSQNRPVMLKTLISRIPLNDEDLEILSGELLMNASTIYISEENFNQHIAPMLTDRQFQLAKQTLQPFYVIKENFLNKNSSNEEQLRNLIMCMRQYSSSNKYTKISNSADTFVYDYIRSKIKNMESKE